MDTRKLRRIAKKYGTPGVLYVGTVLTAHNLLQRKRLMLALGGVGIASLWLFSPVSHCTIKSTLPSVAVAQSSEGDETAEAKYDIIELKPLDGGQFAQATGINNKGVAVGVSDNSKENIRGVVWDNGKIKDMGAFGGEDVAAFGINDRGQTVGWADSGEDLKGFVWENGKFTDVGDLGFPFAVTLGINNSSQAIGISATKDFRLRGFVWERGRLTNIGTLPNFGPSVPSDISDNGTVVGNVYDGDGYPHPFAWRGGKMNELPVWKTNSVAIALNNDNITVGVDFDNEGERVTPILWERGGKPKALPLPGGYSLGIASDINSSGIIVGAVASEKKIAPVLWDKGKIIDLSAQVNGVRLLFAQSINDKGEITAFGLKDQEFVSVVLKPKSRSENFAYNMANWETAGTVAPSFDISHEKGIIALDESRLPLFTGERNQPFYVYGLTPNLVDPSQATSVTLMKLLITRLGTTSGSTEAITNVLSQDGLCKGASVE